MTFHSFGCQSEPDHGRCRRQGADQAHGNVAEARVRFPPAVAAALRDGGLRSPKGPVFDTAIVAGVMGAKRTHELIPFCHPLGLENCRITIELEATPPSFAAR
jgi:molybdenum cofactor biosynthesis enzyme